MAASFAALDSVIAAAQAAVGQVPVYSSDVLLRTQRDYTALCPFVSVHADFEISSANANAQQVIESEDYTLTAWVVVGSGTSDHADHRAGLLKDALAAALHGLAISGYRPLRLVEGGKEVLPGVAGYSLTYRTLRVSSRS